MDTLDFHTWSSVATLIAKPDHMIFDLDTGETVIWLNMQEAAFLVRKLVEALELQAILKTSGGRGLHVVVPIKQVHSWNIVKGLSQPVVQHLAKTILQKFVAKGWPKNRVGKLFVTYLRNGFGATSVSAWSARARPGLGVAVPISWDELQGLSHSAHWTAENIAEHVTVGSSEWDDDTKSARSLNKSIELPGYKNP